MDMGVLARALGVRTRTPLLSSAIKPSITQQTALCSSSYSNLPRARRALFENIERRFCKSRSPSFRSMRRDVMLRMSFSGASLCRRGFIGMSAVAGAMYMWAFDARAMDANSGSDGSVSTGESSGIPWEDPYKFWTIAKKFQAPIILLLTIILGLRDPVALFINVVLILTCTRPDPYSVYIFIEQLRMREQHGRLNLSNMKLFYASKVEVHDYKLMCLANIKLKEKKLSLLGVLGSWWILQSSTIYEN